MDGPLARLRAGIGYLILGIRYWVFGTGLGAYVFVKTTLHKSLLGLGASLNILGLCVKLRPYKSTPQDDGTRRPGRPGIRHT